MATTETKLATRFGNWRGIVVNRDDPLRAGRIQVRILGDHDNKSDVPDDKLFWVHPGGDITSASVNHIGWSPTGIMVGSTVEGFYADIDKTIPYYTSSMYRASIEDPESDHWKQLESPDKKGNDVSFNARGTQEMKNVKNQKNIGKDYVHTIKSSHWQKAQDVTSADNDESVQYKKMKSGGLKTVGHLTWQDGQKMLNIIKQIDPNNEAGAIRSALDGMIALKNITSAGSSLNGGNMFSSLFNGLLGQHSGGGAQAGSGGGAAPFFPQVPVTANNQANANTQSNTATVENFVNAVLNAPHTVKVGSGTQDYSYINSSQNRQATPQSGGTPQTGGSSGGQQQMMQVATQVISALMGGFLGAGGQSGGLGTFNVQQGVIKKMEDAVEKLFSNMQNSPENPGKKY